MAALLSVAAIAAGALLRTNGPLNHDVSWLTIAAQRLIDGGRIGPDIYELNAPGAIALYIPAMWLKSSLGIATKNAVIFWAATVTAGSIALLWPLLQRHVGPSRWPAPALSMPFLAAVWSLLPGYDFAQREHFIFVLTVPYLASEACFATGRKVTAWLRCMATLFVACAVMVKPFFVLLPIAALVCKCRIIGFGVFVRQIEVWLLLLIGFSYVAAIYVWAPDWWRIAQEASVLYRAYDGSWEYVLRLDRTTEGPSIYSGTIALALSAGILFWFYRADRLGAIVLTYLFSAAIISLLIYLVQRKGFHYHLFPVTALLLTAAVIALSFLGQSEFLKGTAQTRYLVGAAGMAAVVWLSAHIAFEGPQLNSRLRDALAKRSHLGVVYAFTSGMRPMFPLVTELELEWGSRYPCLWPLVGLYQQRFARSASDSKLTEEQLGRLEDDLARFVTEDFERSEPATVVVDAGVRKQWLRGPMDFLRYFNSYPEFSEIWRNYELQEAVGPYQIWVRVPPKSETRADD